ncbi:AIPR family protein [Pseudomonas oligotrophica]|uniref:AIPR family protein n=1 Tax=Pseudomonas oligotrophica TaxID=2912055 RepID=UPI001F31A65F|nr:AIPR family protein [Pseudomonas oligotrophica]MCF7203543.1 AIPR family protein [Pseudomonas oligotrophica]
MSTTTEQILIDQILDSEFDEQSEFTQKNDFFEFFCSNLITKDKEISYEDVIEGITDNSLDGGVDALYLFVNGELIKEDFTDYSRFKKDIKIEVNIIQSKNERSFGEDAVHKLRSTSLNLLRLDADLENLAKKYNSKILEKSRKFIECYRALIAKSPSLTINFFYTTKASHIHPNTELEAKSLTSDIKQLHRAANVSFTFQGADELLELHRKKPRKDHILKLAENPMSSTGKAFAALVNLKDYYNFISDDNGNLNKGLFEANVRDYQGNTDVNSGISESLSNHDSIDFWWLNNGITILATDVTIASGKELVLINPEIVNGLQTSNEIYNFYSQEDNQAKAENRNALIKIVVADIDTVRDNIIKAANSQNFIAKAVLRATDPIHRNIEEYLKKFGIYYDRRKNYYKNIGKKPAEIISLPYMAQILISTISGRPDTARARPSTLLEDDKEASYKQIFNPEFNVEIYKNAVFLAKHIDEQLKARSFSAQERNNLKFYVMQDYTVRTLQTNSISASKFAKLNTDTFNEDQLENSINLVVSLYKYHGGNDKAAKGRQLIDAIKAEQSKYFIAQPEASE